MTTATTGTTGTTGTIEAAAARLAALLTGVGGPLADLDPATSDLVLDGDAVPRPLARAAAPPDVWAVDGGQALVADARCLQVVVARAARVRYRDGACVEEEEGPLRAHLVGLGERAAGLASLGLEVPTDTKFDINLLRDRWEWDAVERSIAECEPGGLVLVDGDLQPDWRIPSTYLAELLAAAAGRGVLLAAVTKHSSLSRGGAPLLGQLELEAEATLGPRTTWWAPLGRTRPDLPVHLQIVAARLDPDAPFAFRIDLPGGADATRALGGIAALCDDAAFPGYPYPLTVADRISACPGWLRDDVAGDLDDELARLGVPEPVRRRAFADRHRLMERA